MTVGYSITCSLKDLLTLTYNWRHESYKIFAYVLQILVVYSTHLQFYCRIINDCVSFTRWLDLAMVRVLDKQFKGCQVTPLFGPLVEYVSKV